MIKSYERTPEIRARISEALKAAHKRRSGTWRKTYLVSDETRRKLSVAHKGRKLTPEWIENRTKAQRGTKKSAAFCEKLRVANTGKTHSETSKRKMSASRTGVAIPSLRGGHHPNWKGGLRVENKLIRQSLEYKNWRRSVFSRDDFTCVLCKVRGGKLEADHIKPFSLFIALRFSLENGRTLCAPCHRETDTYGNRALKFKE